MNVISYYKVMLFILICFILLLILGDIEVQGREFDVRDLNVTKNEPLFLTYASSLESTDHYVDQGYELIIDNPNLGVAFKTEHVGIMSFAFKNGNDFRMAVSEFYEKPVIRESYSNMVTFSFKPYKDILVEETFLAYSSAIAFQDIKVTNYSSKTETITVFPYFQYKTLLGLKNLEKVRNGFSFSIFIPADNWTKMKLTKHVERFKYVYLIETIPEEHGIYSTWFNFASEFQKKNKLERKQHGMRSFLVLRKDFVLVPGETKCLRVVNGKSLVSDSNDKLISECLNIGNIKIDEYLSTNRTFYDGLPKCRFKDRDWNLLYHSAFSMLRGQFMQAEGMASYNYYLFSREPIWGWGHGGQVFHESIGTIAYARLNPQSAQDSQRVYFERQYENGYIPYRVGPYLNETIDGETSSGPLLNWEDWEVYKISKDIRFLGEAYEHGVKFYNWWIENRDKDKDGLAEWGGNPILESLRDSHNVIFQDVLGSDVERIKGLEALDLNCMLVREAKSLANMAKELGHEEDHNYWTREANERAQLINRYMWDDETKFYYHCYMDDNRIGRELKRKEMIGFLPLWAGIANQSQAKHLIEHLSNKDEFWRKYGIPSLSADDPYYMPWTGACKWNGPVWPQWQFLLFRGLKEYGYNDLAKELVERVCEVIIHYLKITHRFWEQYNPDELVEQASNPNYYWTGIIAEMMIEYEEL